jgi:hypothetical protein
MLPLTAEWVTKAEADVATATLPTSHAGCNVARRGAEAPGSWRQSPLKRAVEPASAGFA